jgi:hypothetical protein
MKLKHQHHQQHEVGTSSTARSWNNNIINMWQQNEAGASTTFVVL